MAKDAKILTAMFELGKLLQTLTEREAQILKLRFGLEGSHPHTLEEVGKRFHVTRERIRQIEGKALNKLCRKEKK